MEGTVVGRGDTKGVSLCDFRFQGQGLQHGLWLQSKSFLNDLLTYVFAYLLFCIITMFFSSFFQETRI